MPQILCPKGIHFYNPETHSSCPICQEDEAMSAAPAGEAELESKRTMPMNSGTEVLRTDNLASQKTVFKGSGSAVFDGKSLPTAGWLVITEGPGLGRDFRLIQGDNRIGRSVELEVPLVFGDKSDLSVSRETHATVIYDDKSNTFYVNRGGSRNMPTLNGETIMQLQELKAGDVLQVGETKLLFVPLCGGDFRW